MNFLKHIWRFLPATWFFSMLSRLETGTYTNDEIIERVEQAVANKDRLRLIGVRPAYDPSTDENKILMGEVESYFD